MDVEGIVMGSGVKMAFRGDFGVRKAPNGRKEGEKVEGPGNRMTKVSFDKREET